MAIPTLTVISGPPGAGKTTLAHGLAERIGCPAICRDEIKEGMVLAAGPAFGPDDHDPMNWRTLEAFFAVVDTLVRAEVSTIAEAAFQDRLWNPGLSPLLPWARILVIRCHVSADLARARQQDRLADPRRSAHADAAHLVATDPGTGQPAAFDWPRLDVPALDLDTAGDPATALDVAAEFTLTVGGAR